MTHPMLEKMARAMAHEEHGWGSNPDRAAAVVEANWETFIPHARAAVRALMEPDEGMVEAATHVPAWRGVEDGFDMPGWIDEGEARGVWRAMLLPLLEGEGE